MNYFAKNLLDKIGIAVTSLCAIHCLLLPFILPLLPLVGASFIADHHFEEALLLSTMILGSIALYSGYKRYHERLYPFTMLFGGGLIYWLKDDFGVAAEPFMVMIGGGLVVAAHIVNMKLCRRLHECDDCAC